MNIHQDTRKKQSRYPKYHCQQCGLYLESAEDFGNDDVDCEDCFWIFASKHEKDTTEWC